MLTAVCATRTVTVGNASFSNVGRIGAVSSAARVASLLARAAETACAEAALCRRDLDVAARGQRRRLFEFHDRFLTNSAIEL